ncbi:MAG: RcnB family protein [Sphingobium sp.]
MRKIMLTMLMAATVLPVAAVPVAAAAQTQRDVRDARRDLQKEQRQLNKAYRQGDRRDVREQRRDVREARRDYDRELRDYRQSHRSVYARGNWKAPFRYQQWNTGSRIGANYYASRYYVTNPQHYRLRPVASNLRWVRHYDDVLLVNIRTGRVVEVHRGFFW